MVHPIKSIEIPKSHVKLKWVSRIVKNLRQREKLNNSLLGTLQEQNDKQNTKEYEFVMENYQWVKDFDQVKEFTNYFPHNNVTSNAFSLSHFANHFPILLFFILTHYIYRSRTFLNCSHSNTYISSNTHRRDSED